MWPRLLVRYKVWRGKALDISRCLDYPADVLNNESDIAFLFDGISCGSMESFLHSLMESDELRQRHICLMGGREARALPTDHYDGRLWWKGKEMRRDSHEFMALVTRAYEALFVQSLDFQSALLATTGRQLFFTNRGSHRLTLLTEREFCGILSDIRYRSHLILKDVYERQSRSTMVAAQSLAADARKVANELFMHDTERRSFAVHVTADQELFGIGYYFYIAMTPVADTSLELWTVRAGVSDNVFRSGKAVVFGTASIVRKHLESAAFVNAVSNALLENYESFIKG